MAAAPPPLPPATEIMGKKGKMLPTLGARSFSAAAPKLWNGLPEELCQATSLDSFKSRLKTSFLRSIFIIYNFILFLW